MNFIDLIVLQIIGNRISQNGIQKMYKYCKKEHYTVQITRIHQEI